MSDRRIKAENEIKSEERDRERVGEWNQKDTE